MHPSYDPIWVTETSVSTTRRKRSIKLWGIHYIRCRSPEKVRAGRAKKRLPRNEYKLKKS